MPPYPTFNFYLGYQFPYCPPIFYIILLSASDAEKGLRETACCPHGKSTTDAYIGFLCVHSTGSLFNTHVLPPLFAGFFLSYWKNPPLHSLKLQVGRLGSRWPLNAAGHLCSPHTLGCHQVLDSLSRARKNCPFLNPKSTAALEQGLLTGTWPFRRYLARPRDIQSLQWQRGSLIQREAWDAKRLQHMEQ